MWLMRFNPVKQSMKQFSYNTASKPPSEQLDYWSSVISDNYFPLSFSTETSNTFYGQLDCWQLGNIGIYSIKYDPIIYQRDRPHVHQTSSDFYIIAIPRISTIQFTQNGRCVECSPGQFTIQSSESPYMLKEKRGASIGIKIPSEMLRNRIKMPDNFCATELRCDKSAGALFVDFTLSLMRQAESITVDTEVPLSDQLVDLLALTLDSPNDVLSDAESSCQAAHLVRVQRFINMNLSDPELSPGMVAEKCGVSPRYLHLIFKPTGWTVSKWIIERRLQECYNMLKDSRVPAYTIAELAYRWGFSDPSHFSRCFKSRYGITPGDARSQEHNCKNL